MSQPGDKAQQFLWELISQTCLYAARRVPEIADSIADVDRAMRWGFAWELGPFEICDALGVEALTRRWTPKAAICLRCSRASPPRGTSPSTNTPQANSRL